MKTLYLFVPGNELRLLYESAILRHNTSVDQDEYADSGFDLFLAKDETLEVGISKIDYEIKTAMYSSPVIDVSLNRIYHPAAFCVYTRSSIYKTPLRMTNNVGIIDRGYRGNLCSVFDVSAPIDLKVGQRITQICSPDLYPFRVELVDTEDALGKTRRGESGFGSTGS